MKTRFQMSGLRHAEAAAVAQEGVSIQVEYWKTPEDDYEDDDEDDRHQQALLHIVIVLVVVLENRLTPETLFYSLPFDVILTISLIPQLP